MTASIELENYRGFEKYRLEGLSRVNLLVGRNNCGKTAILEAIYFLASGGDPAVLRWIALQRGEMSVVRDEEDSQHRAYHTLLHFFRNREFGLGATFTIRSSELRLAGSIQASVVCREELCVERCNIDGDIVKQREFMASGVPYGPGLVVLVKVRDTSSEFMCPVTDEGLVVEGAFVTPIVPRLQSWNSPRRFITTASLNRDSMHEMWDSVLEEGREDEVIRAMQVLEPDLSGLFFLQGDSTEYGNRVGGVIASFKGSRQRTPLGSHGEGMRRLLALSLALVQCKGGVLLIDEIDTGLHYSVMGDMWRLVVEAARQADVQVFATTHSSDCVRGLAWLCQNYPELGEEVSLQKIVPELDKAVGFDAEGIVSTDQHDIEVR